MMTIRQIERLWTSKTYGKLAENLLLARPEASHRLAADLSHAIPAAAMTLIRLDELSQAHLPLCQQLIRTILAAQNPAGGWQDPLTTALCLRALLANQGHGLAIDAGLKYLSNLQLEEGIWPKTPSTRAPADAYVSAFLLFVLGDHPDFRHNVRFEAALEWFHTHQSTLDEPAHKLWTSAALRCRLRPRIIAQPTLWS